MAALTTDPKSKINPATPHLAELLWLRDGPPTSGAESKADPNIAAAERFVDLLSQGQFEKAAGDFDRTVTKVMPPAELKKLWDGLAAEGGDFKGRGPSRAEPFFVYDIVYVSGTWQHNKIDFKIVFDKQGKIGGLWIVAPQTTAAPVATVTLNGAAAERFVDLLVQGDFDKAAGYFDDTVKKVLKPAQLKELWTGLCGAGGKFIERGNPRAETAYGYEIVFVPIRWERNKLDIQLSFDKQGRIGGLFMVPPGTSVTSQKSGRSTPLVPIKEPRDVSSTVRNAVDVISTCAEGDRRIGEAMESLKGLSQVEVVTELAKSLDSQTDTVRRAAVYVLWKCEFRSVAPAVKGLLKLCDHPEDLTRGMAALALGANHVDRSLAVLEKMTTDDKSGYARRVRGLCLGNAGRSGRDRHVGKGFERPRGVSTRKCKSRIDDAASEGDQAPSDAGRAS